MRGGVGITNFGLRGMEKWATVLTSTREKKSWPKIYPPGATMFDALYSMYVQITARGTGGSADRNLFADFLDQASDLLEKPGLREAAKQFRCCEQHWTGIADAHLPANVPMFAEIHQLLRRRAEALETQAGLKEIPGIRQKLDEVMAQSREQFPLTTSDTRILLNDIRQRVLKMRDAESEAIRVIESAMGISSTPTEPSYAGTVSES
jgi:hypothetical protein